MSLAIPCAVATAISVTLIGCSHRFQEGPTVDVPDAILPIDVAPAPEADGGAQLDARTGQAAVDLADTSSGGSAAVCPPGCQCELGFESGETARWSLLTFDGEVSEPATASTLVHSGTRSLVTSLGETTRFASFKLLLEICPGSTFDLGDRLFSFWVQFDGLPDAPPDAYSGCEAGIVTPDGIHIGISPRVLWPSGRWHSVKGTRAWPIIRSLTIYCVVASPSGGGRVHIDDLRLE